MAKIALAIVVLCFYSGVSIASTAGEEQAKSFVNIYSSLCLKHLSHLDELRDKLRAVPQLPPESAKHFLGERAGGVWPVPDPHGSFLVALFDGVNFCAVYGRRVDTEAVQQGFSAIVATAPSPLVATQVTNKQAQTAANGQTHTVAYEWSVPSAGHKMLFTVTTAPSANALIQAMASAAIVSE